MIERFDRIYERRFEIMEAYRSMGRKVMGWSCTYVPEEIIYAAGVIPIRILGGAPQTPAGDAFLYTNLCSFTRNCMEMAIQGHYSALDGIVGCNTCDHIRRLYDVWVHYLKPPFFEILSLPCSISDTTIEFYATEIYRLKRSLEHYLGKEIKEKDLENSIMVYNETRALLKEIYLSRTTEGPILSGAECMKIVRAGMLMDKYDYNEMLKELLGLLKEQDMPKKQPKWRILLLGSELDNPSFIQFIEDLGIWVVTDDLCMGTRYFWNLVPSNGDPIYSLARRYICRVPCVRISQISLRTAHLQELISLYKVDGVVYLTLKFCDLHGGFFPIIKDVMDELKLPILHIERDYITAGSAQVRTRIQAFIERLEARKEEAITPGLIE